ncbi:MAG: mannose-6-phosphate isomerase, class I [Acidipropionibacterium sp.]|jgi:mannose-6-phosphate isomerase|nr:mannose-6-phosphate isomerase, class I [Acidipropionibacterium sp.]
MRPLIGRVQHYAWGSTDAIPHILGLTPDGAPWAEYWLGAHTSAPSVLDTGSGTASGITGQGTDLDEYLAFHSEEIGDASCRAFGERLPYLVKILSAAHSLSLQAHPSRAQAEAGFIAENAAGVPVNAADRLFRDDWPKPEMIVALTGFEALSGFRDPAESLRLIGGLGVTPRVDEMLRPLRERDARSGLATVIRDCLIGSEQVIVALADLLDAARRNLGRQDAVGDAAETAVELQADHPGDPSILAALLMNRVLLNPGQQIHQPAGTMHAYLRGTGIEIMANSDNVLRGGLTVKHVDVDALLQVADLEPRRVIPSDPEPIGDAISLYRTPYPEFRLWRVEPGDRPVALPGADRGRILLVISGELECSTPSDRSAPARELAVGAGRSAWLAAGEAVSVRAGEPTLAFLAAPGV